MVMKRPSSIMICKLMRHPRENKETKTEGPSSEEVINHPEKEIISKRRKRMLRKWVLIFKKEVHQDSKTKRKKKPLKIMIRI